MLLSQGEKDTKLQTLQQQPSDNLVLKDEAVTDQRDDGCRQYRHINMKMHEAGVLANDPVLRIGCGEYSLQGACYDKIRCHRSKPC